MAATIAAAITTTRISSALPSPAAMEGRSAIIRAFLGQAALQWARGEAPATYGENRNQGRKDVRAATSEAPTKSLSRADEASVREGEDGVVPDDEDNGVEQHADAVEERR
jgi:hypothetical protein